MKNELPKERLRDELLDLPGVTPDLVKALLTPASIRVGTVLLHTPASIHNSCTQYDVVYPTTAVVYNILKKLHELRMMFKAINDEDVHAALMALDGVGEVTADMLLHQIPRAAFLDCDTPEDIEALYSNRGCQAIHAYALQPICDFIKQIKGQLPYQLKKLHIACVGDITISDELVSWASTECQHAAVYDIPQRINTHWQFGVLNESAHGIKGTVMTFNGQHILEVTRETADELIENNMGVYVNANVTVLTKDDFIHNLSGMANREFPVPVHNCDIDTLRKHKETLDKVYEAAEAAAKADLVMSQITVMTYERTGMVFIVEY